MENGPILTRQKNNTKSELEIFLESSNVSQQIEFFLDEILLEAGDKIDFSDVRIKNSLYVLIELKRLTKQ